jgi:hypothetical protein
MTRRGLDSVRKVLLGGTDYLTQQIGVGVTYKDLVRRALHSVCPEIPFPSGWEPEDAARFCDSLAQVPIYALRQANLGSIFFGRARGGTYPNVDEYVRGAGDTVLFENANNGPALANEYASRFARARASMSS